jgi:hypothetical protein
VAVDPQFARTSSMVREIALKLRPPLTRHYRQPALLMLLCSCWSYVDDRVRMLLWWKQM